VRGGAGAVDGINRDVHQGGFTRTQVFPIVEHWGFILLALANDDDAVHLHRVENEAHRIHGGLIRGVFISAADESAGCQRGRLSHTNQIKRKIASRPGIHHKKVSLLTIQIQGI
jgi:hypothetical protein